MSKVCYALVRSKLKLTKIVSFSFFLMTNWPRRARKSRNFCCVKSNEISEESFDEEEKCCFDNVELKSKYFFVAWDFFLLSVGFSFQIYSFFSQFSGSFLFLVARWNKTKEKQNEYHQKWHTERSKIHTSRRSLRLWQFVFIYECHKILL